MESGTEKDAEIARSKLLDKLDLLVWYVIAVFSVIFFFIGEHSYLVFKISLIPLVIFSLIFKYWVKPLHGLYNNGDLRGLRLGFYRVICLSCYLLCCWVVSFFVYFPLFHFFGISAESF